MPNEAVIRTFAGWLARTAEKRRDSIGNRIGDIRDVNTRR